MSTCDNCGAPLTRSSSSSATCQYCSVTNAPLPTRVEVPVPVQVVHKVVQVTGAEGPEEGELRCPHCRKLLVSVIVKDVTLHGCGGCGGIWVDNASASRVLTSPDQMFAELARRAGQNAKGSVPRAPRPICPACPVVLERMRSRGVELDLCTAHGTWFDAYELDSLVRELTDKDPARPVTTIDDRPIHCAGCKQVIAANTANVTPDGLVCDGCWRGEQDALRAAWEKDVQGATAVGGAMLGVAAIMLGAMARRSA